MDKRIEELLRRLERERARAMDSVEYFEEKIDEAKAKGLDTITVNTRLALAPSTRINDANVKLKKPKQPKAGGYEKKVKETEKKGGYEKKTKETEKKGGYEKKQRNVKEMTIEEATKLVDAKKEIIDNAVVVGASAMTPNALTAKIQMLGVIGRLNTLDTVMTYKQTLAAADLKDVFHALYSITNALKGFDGRNAANVVATADSINESTEILYQFWKSGKLSLDIQERLLEIWNSYASGADDIFSMDEELKVLSEFDPEDN